jgi:hypothetical protein
VATNTYGGFYFTDNSTCTGNSYSITGNALNIAGVIKFQVDFACHNQNVTITQAVTLTTDSVFTVDGILSFNSTLALGAHRLDINETNNGFVSPGILTGTGPLYYTETGGFGSLWGISSSPGYSGAVSVTGGIATLENSNSLGTGSVTLELGGRLQFNHTTGGAYIFPNNITIKGTEVYGGERLTVKGVNSVTYPVSHPATTNNYGITLDTTTTFNFTGTITLQASATIVTEVNVTVSGNLIGPTFTLSTGLGYPGNVAITAATNTSASANGTIPCQVYAATFSDSLSANTAQIGRCNIITVTGTRGAIYVYDTGILKGTGTIGALTSAGGQISPGMSPGVLNTGNVVFDSSTTLNVELGGTGAGSFDQLNVTGTVSLGNAVLSPTLYGGFVPSIGNSFTIINNDGSDPVAGTFTGLSEGASVSLSGYKFTISYVGGTGNDVVLTTTYVPGPPGTGSKLLSANPLLPTITIISGLGLVIIATKGKKAVYKKTK